MYILLHMANDNQPQIQMNHTYYLYHYLNKFIIGNDKSIISILNDELVDNKFYVERIYHSYTTTTGLIGTNTITTGSSTGQIIISSGHTHNSTPYNYGYFNYFTYMVRKYNEKI